MRVGIIGSGEVAQALAGGFLKYGHEVTLGTRHPDKLSEWQTTHPRARVGSFADTAASAEVVVLSVKGSAASDALVHSLVHSRISARRVVARVQAASLRMSSTLVRLSR